jgi:hypothetical protein
VSPESAEYFRYLLYQFQRRADRVPSPGEPPDSATEQAADEWWHRHMRHDDEWEYPSPEVAAAMIPRVMYAKLVATDFEKKVRTQEPYNSDSELFFDVMQEELLLRAWHQRGRESWLRGEWGWPAPPTAPP